MDIVFNKKIWTILMTLLILFSIVAGLKYLGLYNGIIETMDGLPGAMKSSEMQVTTQILE